MKFSIPTVKPRNPLVAPVRLRRSGAHVTSAGAQRQQAARALRQDIERLRPSP